MEINKRYDASSIQVLSGLDAIRQNLGMYIGSNDINGLHHLPNEIIDNAIDEVTAGYCDQLIVTLHRNGACSIEDNGRGIPTDHHETLGDQPACEILLTTLHSGSKFHDEIYKKSAGLHGVGLSCVNALSSWLELEIWRDDQYFTQRYQKGIPQTSLQSTKSPKKTGTKLTFAPDPICFSETTKFSRDKLRTRLQELAYLHPTLTIFFNDDVDNTQETIRYQGGLSDFLFHLTESYKKIPAEPIMTEFQSENLDCDMALQWTNSHEEKMISYVNSVKTIYGGTHEDATKNVITDVLNEFALQYKLISPNELLTYFDIFEGLFVILSLRMVRPVFEGQTKIRLTNQAIYEELYQIIYQQLHQFFHENTKVTILLIKKAQSTSLARLAARSASDAIIYQYKEIEISEKVYKTQFDIRSKNWHDSATWITDDELLKKHVELLEVDENALALDVCCGSGVVGASFKPKVKKVIGFDLTPEMIALAKTRLDEVHQGNVYHLPFEDNRFDLVVTREVLHLLPQPERPLAHIYRTLKPGGQFIVGQIVPFSHDDGPWMYRVFKKKQPLIFNMFQEEDFIEMLLKAGFVDLKTTEINVWEPIDVWINTVETSIQHRHEIKDLFYNAPVEAKSAHPFKILPDGKIFDLWRWIVFSVRKPKQ